MYNYLKRFFLFLLPILRKAAVQVLADELTRVAYPETARRRRPYYSSLTHHYHPYAPRSTRYKSLSEARIERDNARKARRIQGYRGYHMDPKQTAGFHDVLLVAFDLSGPNAQATHEWLHENLPSPGTGGDNDEINLDSWWVANDDRFDGSDADSAVFVPFGKQAQARDWLDGSDSWLDD